MIKDGVINGKVILDIGIAADKYIQAISDLKPDGNVNSKYTRVWRTIRDYFDKQFSTPGDYSIVPKTVTEFFNIVNKYFGGGSMVKSAGLSAATKTPLRIGIRTKAYSDEPGKNVFTLYDLIDGYDLDVYVYKDGVLTSKNGYVPTNTADFVKTPNETTIVVYTDKSALLTPDEYGIPDVTNAEMPGLPWYIWAVGGFFLWRVLK